MMYKTLHFNVNSINQDYCDGLINLTSSVLVTSIVKYFTIGGCGQSIDQFEKPCV